VEGAGRLTPRGVRIRHPATPRGVFLVLCQTSERCRVIAPAKTR